MVGLLHSLFIHYDNLRHLKKFVLKRDLLTPLKDYLSIGYTHRQLFRKIWV